MLTASRLIHAGAGPPAPEGAIPTDAPCWWCGLPSPGSGRPVAAAIPDTFPDRHRAAAEAPEVEGRELATGARASGYTRAGALFGPRYVSGVRAEESRTRRIRVARWGLSTGRTCAPIGRWTGADVFAYLCRHGLPVHPAYACTRGGLLDRERVRVASLGGSRGTGMGRREWEREYYGAELAALGL